MRRRTFLRSLGMLTLAPQLVAADGSRSPARSQLGPGTARVLAPNDIPALLTPEPQQAAFGGPSISLDSGWSVVLTDAGDVRTTALADRIVGHLAQLGGPRLSRQVLQSGQDLRRRIFLVVLDGSGSIPAADRLGSAADDARMIQLLSSHESQMPSRIGGPLLRRREAYSLVVESDRVVIAANAPEGLLPGGQTLMQLMTIGAMETPARLPQGRIVDWPVDALRGYLADVRKPPYRFTGSAHDGWLRHIDRLAAAKCNYIVFEQSLGFQYAFPGEPVGFPGGFRIDVGRALSDYAYGQGIMLIPMVDLSRGDSLRPFMERHPGRHPWMTDHQNRGFCPFNERSYAFIDRMLAELVAAFPYSPYLHVGEDESSAIAGSDSCPRCRQAIARYASESGLPPDPIGYPMAYFQTQVSELAKRRRIQTMVWGTYGFLNDAGIREVVPRVMSKDVIVWDWLGMGFAKVGYPTWNPYLPSWEWKGPGVRDLITHMVAFMTKAAWDGRANQSAAGMEAFARAWSLTTFGIDEPDIGRRCLSIFGQNPYGWSFGDDSSRSRWMRVRFGAYLCLKPEDFRESRYRHPSVRSLADDLARFARDAAYFDDVARRAKMNRFLAEWYTRGASLSFYGLQYVQGLLLAYQALQLATRDMLEPERRQLLDSAQRQLQMILDRLAGPITAIASRSQDELGGPVLDSMTNPLLDYDVTGVRNGVRAAIETVLKRVARLSAGRPVPDPTSLGMFPPVAGV